MSQSLTGKTAIITGASKGIGRATATALAKEGVHLGLIARNEDGLNKVANELKTDGIEIATATADVGNRSEVDSAVADLKEKLGTIDILINNCRYIEIWWFLRVRACRMGENNPSKFTWCILYDSCCTTNNG